MIKTKIIVIQVKDTTCSDHACGNCFAKLEYPTNENYCWSCGADLTDENWAYDINDLKKKAK